MLNEDDNNGSWQLINKRLDDLRVHGRYRRILESARYGSQDGEAILLCLSVMSVDQPADQGIKQNDKSCSKGGYEEEHLGSARLSSSCKVAKVSDQVKHGQCCQTHRSIKLGPPKVL